MNTKNTHQIILLSDIFLLELIREHIGLDIYCKFLILYCKFALRVWSFGFVDFFIDGVFVFFFS